MGTKLLELRNHIIVHKNLKNSTSSLNIRI